MATVRAVFLADLHVGSHWGLADPNEPPRKSPGLPVMRRLYDEWCRAANGPWHAPDALVVDGDAIEGQSRKDGGTHAWTTDVMEQILHAVALLRMWKARSIYILGGSKYHVMLQDTGFSAEEMLGRELGAESYPNQEHIPETERRRSGIHWFITFADTTIHFAHHISISRVFAYMSTPIARTMMQAKLNDPMARKWEEMYRKFEANPKELLAEMLKTRALYKTRATVRAHAHYFWMCDSGGSLGVCLPAWKVPDPFILGRDPLGFGHIGFIGFEATNGEGYRVEKNLIRLEDVSRPPHSIVQGSEVRGVAGHGHAEPGGAGQSEK